MGLLAARYWGIPFIDVCPDEPKSARCDEMLTWLSNHPEVTRYAVVDDENDCLDELPLFQPSAKTGLSDDIVEGLEKFLNGETDKTMKAPAVVRLGQNIYSLFKREKS